MNLSYKKSISEARQAAAQQKNAAYEHHQTRFEQQFPGLLSILRDRGFRCGFDPAGKLVVGRYWCEAIVEVAEHATEDTVLLSIDTWVRYVKGQDAITGVAFSVASIEIAVGALPVSSLLRDVSFLSTILGLIALLVGVVRVLDRMNRYNSWVIRVKKSPELDGSGQIEAVTDVAGGGI